MPELTTWILIISVSSFNAKAIDHIEGFTQDSCTEAALRVESQLSGDVGKFSSLKVFCIPRIGRRY